MRIVNSSICTAVALILVTLATSALAADAKKSDKPKPYILTTCPVSGDEFAANKDMKPYTFVYKDREIKLCCDGCLSDFKKNASKYIKKIETEEKKAKK